MISSRICSNQGLSQLRLTDASILRRFRLEEVSLRLVLQPLPGSHYILFAADLLPRLLHQARPEIPKALLLIIQAGLALFGQSSC